MCPPFEDPSKSQHAQAILAAIVESSDDAIVSKDLDGVVTSWNASAERIFGYTADEMIGRPISILVPPERPEDEPAILAKLRLGERIDHYETVRIRKDGERIDISVTISPIRDESGVIVGASKVARDITMQRRRERLLAESQAMFQGLFEHSPDAIVVIEGGGRIRRVNAQLERLFGYKRDELHGSATDRLLPDRLRGREVFRGAGGFKGSRAGAADDAAELHGQRSDGREFPMEVLHSPAIPLEDGLVIAVIRDISERKAAEEQAREAMRRGVLLREIHHRMKNNLQVVSSMLSLHSEYLRDEQALSAITESQNRIRSIALIHEKLYQSSDLGRIEFHGYVSDLCTSLFHSYGAPSRGVSLAIEVVDLALNLDTAVPCGLLINELVSNALKHAFPDARPGTIRVDMRRIGERLAMTVSDDGVGFPDSVDFGKTQTLGLQLVNILAHQLEGSVGLEKTGGGTRVHVDFAELSYAERI